MLNAHLQYGTFYGFPIDNDVSTGGQLYHNPRYKRQPGQGGKNSGISIFLLYSGCVLTSLSVLTLPHVSVLLQAEICRPLPREL